MKFAPYTSGRLKQLKIGITSHSEDKTPLEVVGSVSVGGSITVNNSLTVNNIAVTSTTSTSNFANLNVTGVSTFGGNVGIGTDNVNAVVGVSNTSILAVGILTANRIFSTVYGQFTGGSVLADNIVGSALSISGISTFGGNVAIGTDDVNAVVGTSNTSILAVGILTANRIFSTVYGQFTGGSVLADNIVGSALSISGISTFGGNVAIGTDDVNAVVGTSNTSILAVGILTANRIFSTVYGQFTGGSVLADNIVGSALSISGISTFGGNVAIGTDDATARVGVSNTSILAVGILTANRIYSTVYGEFTGGTVTADNLVGTALSVSGISTLGTVQISSGIVTATSGIVTYFGDGSNLTGIAATDNVRTGSLVVSGISTFSDLVDVNAELNTQGGRIVGAATSNVIPFLYANYSDLPSAATYHGAFAHVHATGKAYYAHAGAWFELVNKEADGRVGTGTEVYNIGSVDATSLDVSGISTFTGAVGFTTDISLPDHAKINLGTGNDLQIYHNYHSYIKEFGPGGLFLDANQVTIGSTDNLKNSIIATPDTDVQLYYNGSEKIRTTGVGVSVYGTTQTQQLNVSGVSTFSSLVDVNNRIDVTGGANVDQLNVTGVSTFVGNINANGNIIGDGATDISGIGSITATTYHGDGSDLVGVAKSTVLEDAGINTSGTSTFTNVKVTGISTLGANVIVGGATTDLLVTGDVRIVNNLKVGSSTINIDGVSDSITASNLRITGVTTVGTILDVDGSLDVDGQTELDDVNVSGVSTFAGNINANGNIVGDNATNISGINSVTATSFFGNGQGLTNVTADSVGDLTDLKVTGLSTFVGDAQFDGNVSIAGTLTYEDVTNIDSVGLITARTGIKVLAGGINAVGVVTATTFSGSGANLTSLNASELTTGTVPDGRFPATLPTASGVNLTNVSAVFATKAGIATYTSSWAVTANGASSYRFSGPGNLSTQDNPTIYLVRGQQYEFDLNASGHPFLILVSSGGSSYTDGVTTVGNNSTGKIRFDVPMDAPSELFYQCQYHSGMLGKFEITDGSKIVQGNSKVEVVDTGSNGHVKVETEGVERLRINSSGHLVPGTDSQYDIGTNTVRFANIYGDTFYGDGSNLSGVGVGTDGSLNTTGIITAASFSGDGQDLDKVSIGSTDGNFIGKGYLQAQKTVNAGGSRGNANIILGRFAGCCHDGSSYNVYLGDQAGRKSSSGSTNRNVFIGCQAGCGNTTGYHNVFLGSEAGKGVCGDSGSMNLFAGLQAGMRNTGCYNIAFGKHAYGRQTGSCNIAIGHMAANDVGAGGTSNVFIGDCAGYNAQVNGPPCRGGMSNVYVGTNAGYQNPGDFNIGIGDNSLNGNSSVSAGCRNIALGQCSGHDIQGGKDNVFLGSCAGAKITTGFRNVFLGCNAGCCAKALNQSIYVGCDAGQHVCAGNDDIGLGSVVFTNSKHACGNIAFGNSVFCKLNCYGGTSSFVSRFNFGVGQKVGIGLTLGDCNIMMGYIAGYCINEGDTNIFIGRRAGEKVTSSCCNIFIGSGAGSQGTAVNADNVFVGNYAGSYTGSATRGNTFLGKAAGFCATDGCWNVAIGEYAGCGVTGNRNIFMGYYTGLSANNSGVCNVAIGPMVSLPSASGDNQLVIGVGNTSWIAGDSSYNVTLAGIATVTKATGVVEATKFCGDGSCLSGLTWIPTRRTRKLSCRNRSWCVERC